MAWNEYLHAWGTYAICPFANAVVLATEQPVPVTAIAMSNQTVAAQANKDVTITLTPANATSDIEFTSSDETVFTVSKVNNTKCNIVGVSAGNGTLTATAENGVTKTATVTVTS